MIELQRVYEHHKTHGTRFLVERLWPRGIRKESLHFSDWLEDVAPSDSVPFGSGAGTASISGRRAGTSGAEISIRTLGRRS